MPPRPPKTRRQLELEPGAPPSSSAAMAAEAHDDDSDPDLVELFEEDPEEDPEEEEYEEVEEEEYEEVEEEVEEEEPVREEERSKKEKKKDFEVFFGGLPRDATEEDVRKACARAGEVVEVRLVRDPHSGLNKGFAFVRFATTEQAKRAATELRHTQVKGKSCGIMKSNKNETLHLANICTTWTKDDLIEKLKEFALENLEEVHLIEDRSDKGKNRGFAFLDFSTHIDALAACSKFQKRYILLGTETRAELSFAMSLQPDEEVMAQVRSVFVDGLPANWDVAQVRAHFEEFGEIESIQLASNMLTAKRKDFGFICFSSRQSALDCIEKVNKDGISVGDQKVLVKATLKRPLQKRTLPRGGYFGGRKLYTYETGYSFPRRPVRSRYLTNDGSSERAMRFNDFPYRRIAGAQFGRKFTRDLRDKSIKTRSSGYPHVENSLSGRHALWRYQDSTTTYSRSREPYSNSYIYGNHEPNEAYEYPAVSGYKRSYSDLDDDMMETSFITRYGRRQDLRMDAYAQHRGYAYNEYPRYSPDEPIGYNRANRAEYESRKYQRQYSYRG